ncbi:MAG TPA: hypothetical protein VF781_13865, partial [Solirubrobacteraceae bacterium]
LGAYLPGGNQRPLGCCTAGPAYDEASGLGSPNLAKLATLAVALQPPIARVGLSLPRQSPAAHGHLLARLSCSRRCNALATAVITVSRGRRISVSSARQLFLRGGRRTIALGFSPAQLRRLRGALRRHAVVIAHVVGQVLDPDGLVEARTAVRGLRIRG